MVNFQLDLTLNYCERLNLTVCLFFTKCLQEALRLDVLVCARLCFASSAKKQPYRIFPRFPYCSACEYTYHTFTTQVKPELLLKAQFLCKPLQKAECYENGLKTMNLNIKVIDHSNQFSVAAVVVVKG